MILKHVVYEIDYFTGVKKSCAWILYPFFRGMVKIRYLKIWIYHYLNQIGVMKTPWGCVMRLTDIPAVGKVVSWCRGVK